MLLQSQAVAEGSDFARGFKLRADFRKSPYGEIKAIREAGEGGTDTPPCRLTVSRAGRLGLPNLKKSRVWGKQSCSELVTPPKPPRPAPLADSARPRGCAALRSPAGWGGDAPRRNRAEAAQEPYRGVRGRGSRVAHPTARGAVHPHPRGLRRTGIWGEAAA